MFNINNAIHWSLADKKWNQNVMFLHLKSRIKREEFFSVCMLSTVLRRASLQKNNLSPHPSIVLFLYLVRRVLSFFIAVILSQPRRAQPVCRRVETGRGARCQGNAHSGTLI